MFGVVMSKSGLASATPQGVQREKQAYFAYSDDHTFIQLITPACSPCRLASAQDSADSAIAMILNSARFRNAATGKLKIDRLSTDPGGFG